MRIHGNRGQVQMDATGGSTLVEVADLNEWNLDLARDRVDVTCFGDTNKKTVNGLPAYSGTFAGFWNKDSTPEFFDAVLGDTPVTLGLVMDMNDPTYLFKGLANLDGGIKVSANGAVSIAGKFDGAGDWVREPVGVTALGRARLEREAERQQQRDRRAG